MSAKLARMLACLQGLQTIKSFSALITWFCKVTWHTKTIISSLHTKLITTYDHETRQGGDIPWRAPTHKVTWSLNHVALQGDVACWIFYISASTFLPYFNFWLQSFTNRIILATEADFIKIKANSIYRQLRICQVYTLFIGFHTQLFVVCRQDPFLSRVYMKHSHSIQGCKNYSGVTLTFQTPTSLL